MKPDPVNLEKLKGLNLVEMLGKEIDNENWDIGRIRVLFRALKIVKPEGAIQFVIDRFDDLVVFAKELVLLMEALEEASLCCFEGLRDRVIAAILSPGSSRIQIIRTWLLEIFVRDVVSIAPASLKKLQGLPTVLDKKQLLLIRGRCRDINHFRKQKTAVQSFSEVERGCLVWGASCLPQDEYELWLQKMVGLHMNRPLDALFLKWASKNRSTLMSKLKAPITEHPE